MKVNIRITGEEVDLNTNNKIEDFVKWLQVKVNEHHNDFYPSALTWEYERQPESIKNKWIEVESPEDN